MSQGRLGCGYCRFWYNTNEEYETHFLSKQHLEYMTRWFCSSCHIQLYSANEWDKHLSTSKHKTNSNIMFTCDLCNYTTGKEAFLKQHNQTQKHIRQVQGIVKPDNFTCTLCDYTCGNETFLRRHNISKKHLNKVNGVVKPPPKEYTCETCNYMTITKDNMERHLLTKTHIDAEKGIFKIKLSEYTCEPCNYKTPFKQSLHSHTLSKKHQKRTELPAETPIQV